MAEQLLARFEELFRPIGEMLEFRPSNQQQQHQQQDRVFDEDEELQASSWNDLEESFVLVAKKSSSENEDGLLQRGQVPVNPMPTVQSSVRTPSPMKAPSVKPLKQPKPKAKDPNKREMSMEEKHKLGNGLQSLQPEKMEQVVQIIRKRNGNFNRGEERRGEESNGESEIMFFVN